MISHLEAAIEEALRNHGYEDNSGQLETLQRRVENLQLALARLTAVLVDQDYISLRDFQGPEYLSECHFVVEPTSTDDA